MEARTNNSASLLGRERQEKKTRHAVQPLLGVALLFGFEIFAEYRRYFPLHERPRHIRVG